MYHGILNVYVIAVFIVECFKCVNITIAWNMITRRMLRKHALHEPYDVHVKIIELLVT